MHLVEAKKVDRFCIAIGVSRLRILLVRSHTHIRGMYPARIINAIPLLGLFLRLSSGQRTTEPRFGQVVEVSRYRPSLCMAFIDSLSSSSQGFVSLSLSSGFTRQCRSPSSPQWGSTSFGTITSFLRLLVPPPLLSPVHILPNNDFHTSNSQYTPRRWLLNSTKSPSPASALWATAWRLI